MIKLLFFAVINAEYFETGSSKLPANLFCENFIDENDREKWRGKYAACE